MADERDRQKAAKALELLERIAARAGEQVDGEQVMARSLGQEPSSRLAGSRANVGKKEEDDEVLVRKAYHHCGRGDCGCIPRRFVLGLRLVAVVI
jgi:hypothetical protein